MSQLKRASVFTRKVSAFLFPVLYSCTSCRVSRAGCVLGWMTAFQGQGEPSCPRRGGAQGRGQPGGVRAQCPWFTRIRNLEHETSREPPASLGLCSQGTTGPGRRSEGGMAHSALAPEPPLSTLVPESRWVEADSQNALHPPFSGIVPLRKPSLCSGHVGLWDEGHQGDLGSGETMAGSWPRGHEPPTSRQATEALE